MDDNFDQHFSTSPRLDSSSWEYEHHDETKCHQGNAFGELGNNENAFHTDPASNWIQIHNAVNGNIDHIVGGAKFSGEPQSHMGIDNFNNNCPKGIGNGRTKDQHDVTLPRFHQNSCDALQELKPDASEDGSLSKSCSVGETIPPVYDGFSLSDILAGSGMHAFGREIDGIDIEIEGRYINTNIFPLNEFSASTITKDNVQGLQSFVTESIKAKQMTTTGLPQALLEATYTPDGEFNISGKPRVRARRGQATDPHSIAERIRREKISDRMKSLQELVPNSCKTDKASMLNDIIEYVRFLQLQVKVLSTSRVREAEAVVPLLTEGSTKALRPFSCSLERHGLSESADHIALEKEIMKLMDINVSKVVQYLQSRDICLMPIALASAISDVKCHEGKNSGNLVHNKSGSSSGDSSVS